MNLSRLSVSRGVTFGLLYLVVAGFGVYSLSRLQLDLFPDITFPTVAVLTEYTGASPEDIETLVTRPLESAVASVDNIEEVVSTSKQGASLIQANFDWGVDMDQAETDVRRALDLYKGALPDDAGDPVVFAMSPSMQPIVILVLRGDLPQEALRDLAEDEIKPALERLSGIATADVSGGLERQIQVHLDPARIAAYGIDVNQVVGAIYRENLQEPGGTVAQGDRKLNIQTSGKYQSVEEIEQVLLGIRKTTAGPVPLVLGDVAEVTDGFAEIERSLQVDGRAAVVIQVRKQSGENTVKAAEGVLEALPNIVSATGQPITFDVIQNQADFINRSLSNLSSTALGAMFISFAVLLLFLRNVRTAAIVSSAIPLSVVATFSVMDQADITLNVLSMAGLALAIGMLVDNAIVVLENIFRLREEGMGLREASIRGAGGVSLAVVAATLTTVSVFVPVLFVPGIAGVLFVDMAVTISVALLVSLLVALTFIPLATSRWLKVERRATAQNGSELEWLRRPYGRALDWALLHRWVVGAATLGLLVLTVGLLPSLRTDFMPTPDKSQIELNVELPTGATLEHHQALLSEVVAQVADTIPENERELIYTTAGSDSGAAALFGTSATNATVYVRLVREPDRQRSQHEIMGAVLKATKSVAGVRVTKGGHDNLGGNGDITVELVGHELADARRVSTTLRDKLSAMPEIASVTMSVEGQQPQLQVDYDRRVMSQLGISANSVSQAVSTAFQGRVAGRFAEDGDEHDILVRYDDAHRLDSDEVSAMPLVTSSGTVTFLGNVATVTEELSPTAISRSDQRRLSTLTIALADRYQDQNGEWFQKNLAGSMTAVDEVVAGVELPAGFAYHIGGTAEDFAESFQYLGLALLVSIFLVYVVMASLFESFRQPFIILFTIPLALVGVVLIFALTQSVLDVSALIGVIMLVGIVVNNGIVLVDAANQWRAEGLEMTAAVAKAARLRLRPVLLTSLTTILSMLPLALEWGEGAAQWSGMARSVIGGLMAASALTLFVVPTIYTLLATKTRQQPTEELTPALQLAS